MSKKKAEKLNRLANELEEEGKIEDAIKAYKQAIKNDKNWSVSYYNLGLLYKREKDWKKSFYYNFHAARLDKSDEAAWWNMGIAASALGDWKMAKRAWKGFGINVPSDGKEDDEPKMEIGITPVRLIENREVVWTKRLDPARVMIENIPTPESKRRYLDIVLNDGAPNGMRFIDDRPFHVFDELQLLKPSEYMSFQIWVADAKEFQINSLEKRCGEKGFGFENWTNSLRQICKQCSEGAPHQHHDEELKKNKKEGEFILAIAAKSEAELKEVLEAWKKEFNISEMEWERFI
ncbi:MAG TPA: tetratricopeptide repeat protein [Bacteroidetes bacterium]|nr:tetratricopeptide repeat protein [Bacteroidota bacterium]